jgi:hypothetical protein
MCIEAWYINIRCRKSGFDIVLEMKRLEYHMGTSKQKHANPKLVPCGCLSRNGGAVYH